MVRNNADATNGCKNGCYEINLTQPDTANVSGTALGDDKMIAYPGRDNVKGCSLSIPKQEENKKN